MRVSAALLAGILIAFSSCASDANRTEQALATEAPGHSGATKTSAKPPTGTNTAPERPDPTPSRAAEARTPETTVPEAAHEAGTHDSQSASPRELAPARPAHVTLSNLDTWEKLATSGDKFAQLRLGLEHALGGVTIRDPDAALRWLRRAAKAGPAEAHYQLGMLLEGDEREDELRSAAVGEHVRAQYELAMLLLGRTADDEHGLAMVHKAAATGLPEAQVYLGTLPTTEPNKAIEFLELAAAQGHGEAIHRLGRIRHSGSIAGKPAKRDLALAWMWMTLGCAFDRPENGKFFKWFAGIHPEDQARCHSMLLGWDVDWTSRAREANTTRAPASGLDLIALLTAALDAARTESDEHQIGRITTALQLLDHSLYQEFHWWSDQRLAWRCAQIRWIASIEAASSTEELATAEIGMIADAHALSSKGWQPAETVGTELQLGTLQMAFPRPRGRDFSALIAESLQRQREALDAEPTGRVAPSQPRPWDGVFTGAIQAEVKALGKPQFWLAVRRAVARELGF